MSRKSFVDYRKPYLWVALFMILMIIFAGVHNIPDKGQTISVSDQKEKTLETEILKESAEIKEGGVEDEFTEIHYVSDHGYQLWYPENLKILSLDGYDRFTDLEEANVEMILVPQEMEMDLNDDYLKEAVGNYRVSGEYDDVSVSNVKNLTSDDENISIHMIEVVHDGDMNRFYIVKGEEQTLLITVSLQEEAVEEWKTKITRMVQTITFNENEK